MGIVPSVQPDGEFCHTEKWTLNISLAVLYTAISKISEKMEVQRGQQCYRTHEAPFTQSVQGRDVMFFWNWGHCFSTSESAA